MNGVDSDVLKLRERAASKYRPDHIRLLLVAEAPPAAPDRYFYFEDVPTQDSLFRYIVRTVLGEASTRDRKAEHLQLLKSRAVYLVDLKTSPKDAGEDLSPYVAGLVDRAAEMAPDYVITIKANVCDLCQQPLRSAGLNVSDERIPFPGSGQQVRFVTAMESALAKIGWIA